AGAAAAAPGAAAVVGALCFVCSALVAPGHVAHQDYGAVTAGALHGPFAAADELASDLRGAGFEATATPDLVSARWRKLLWNVPFNGLATLLDADTDELLADPAGRALVVALMEEVVAGGRACGAVLGPDDVDRMVALTEAMVPYRPSMALDAAAGRPLEHDAIHGAPVRAAAAAGTVMPRVEQLWLALDLVDRRLRRTTTGAPPATSP
ncbi:MAG: 2-dehydropantoate 2-reductase, partial [Acidimicrobiia bacterium]|nr:2-dehydropantoate 2-reductase [Acidimicrobiia bacterium]